MLQGWMRIKSAALLSYQALVVVAGVYCPRDAVSWSLELGIPHPVHCTRTKLFGVQDRRGPMKRAVHHGVDLVVVISFTPVKAACVIVIVPGQPVAVLVADSVVT